MKNADRQRAGQRHRKRMRVDYGIGKTDKFGFIEDLNDGGIYIKTTTVGVPGSLLQIEIKTPDGLIAMLGEVRWSKKVPAAVLHRLKGGMGIQIKGFLAGEGLYHDLCKELAARHQH